MKNPTDLLASAALEITAIGAREYLAANKLTADTNALLACCRSWTKIKLPEALNDAREAIECHMNEVAEATFKATMILAGIEAAKEAARAALAAARDE